MSENPSNFSSYSFFLENIKFSETILYFIGPEEKIMENPQKISDREDKYLQRKKLRQISPERHDPFKDADKTPDINSRSYQDIMAEQKIENERQEVLRRIAKQKEEALKKLQERNNKPEISAKPSSSLSTSVSNKSEWEKASTTETKIGASSKWDTPGRGYVKIKIFQIYQQ
jgi:hypothetical protein